MSLNGLEDPVVVDAYHATLTEAGGWLLLKYVTRDKVELFRKGASGIVEVRLAINQYREKSPIYGLLQYRRRKVVLKYVPEGTSRLLQARLTVQFQSVLEKFTPHDAVFTFTAAIELTEAALSSACMLHASIGSKTSSTSSLHRGRLEEITEAIEECGDEQGREVKEESRASSLRHSVLSQGESTPRGARDSDDTLRSASPNIHHDVHLLEGGGWAPATALQISEMRPASASDKSPYIAGADASRSTIDSQASVAVHTIVTPDVALSHSDDPRKSSDSQRSTHQVRSSPSDPDQTKQHPGYASYKPKTRLAPRPSAKLPSAPGLETRPVANLPNSVRISNRPPTSTLRPSSSTSSRRPTSQMSNKSTGSAFHLQPDHSPPPPLPRAAIHISALHPSVDAYLTIRPSSPASLAGTLTRSPALSITGPPSTKSEKQKLMRALQLRKTQQMTQAKELERANQPELGPGGLDKTNASLQEVGLLTESTDEAFNSERSSILVKNLNMNDKEVPLEKNVVVSVSPVLPTTTNTHLYDTATTVVRPPRVDSSLGGKDTGMVSSAAESESATSIATDASLQWANTVADKLSVSSPKVSPPSSVSAPSQLARQDSKQHAFRAPPIRYNSAVDDIITKTNRSLVHAASVETEIEPVTRRLDQVPDYEAFRRPAIADALTISEPEAIDIQAKVPGRQVKSQRPPKAKCNQLESSNSSEDEAFYDELQTAVVEEAKPVTFARAPFSAVVNTTRNTDQRSSGGSAPLPVEEAHCSKSTPERSRVGPASSSSPKVLQSSPPLTCERAQSLLTNKANVSSGISKRIKALEVLSARGDASPNSPTSPLPPSPPLTTGLFKKRMSSHFPQEFSAPSTSMSSPPANKIPYPSPARTPTPPLTSKAGEPSSFGQSVSTPEPAVRLKKGNSISVAAQIVEGSYEKECIKVVDSPDPVGVHPRQRSLLRGHESSKSITPPIVPNVTQTTDVPTVLEEPDLPQVEAHQTDRRRFSFSSSHSNYGKPSHSGAVTKRLSITIRSGRNDFGKPASTSDSSSSTEEKVGRGSRKGRLMKRLSTLSGTTRLSMASAFGSRSLQEGSVTEISPLPESIVEDSGELSHSSSSFIDPQAHVVDIGDVNIQFPDTLLWKRRFMRIDDQGYLVLTPPTMETNRRGVSRRFHLTDFKKPCLPSVDQEELPWSILLCFDDGSCLQCACESRYGQAQMLRSGSLHCSQRRYKMLIDSAVLTDAHDAYNSLYQRP